MSDNLLKIDFLRDFINRLPSDVIEFAGKDAAIRTEKKLETALIKAVRSEFKRIPKNTGLEKVLHTEPIISPNSKRYGARVTITHHPTWAFDVLSDSTKKELEETRGVKFGERTNKKGVTKTKRTSKKPDAYEGRIASSFRTQLKKSVTFLRSKIFVVKGKHTNSLVQRVAPGKEGLKDIISSSAAEIMTNELTSKGFINKMNISFAKRFMGRVEYKMKELLK